MSITYHYFGADAVTTSRIQKFEFTATAGQTVFDVFAKYGVKLSSVQIISAFNTIQTSADYTLAVDGSTITLTTPAAAGDVVVGTGLI